MPAHRPSVPAAALRGPSCSSRLRVYIVPVLLGLALGVQLLRADPPDAPPAATAAAVKAPAPTATDAEIALQRKLDQPFDLTLQKVELSEAFKQIAATAQISLQVDPACYDALPYGATTQISADFRQSKLKSAIEEVLVPLSLQQTVSGSMVVIRPSGPLARIGRRADWEELKLLQDLRTSGDLKLPPNGDFEWTAALRGVLDNRPNLVVSMYTPADPAAAQQAAALNDKAMDQLKKQFPLSAFGALELYCQLTHQIWFVEAGPLGAAADGGNAAAIRIMPMRAWIDRQLERPIKLDFTNAPLDQVVSELAHVSGIRFTPEPGLYQAIPMVSVSSSNSSVLKTLEALSGGARIAFDIRDDSIYLHLAGNPPAAPALAARDWYLARVAVPIGSSGLSMDVFIRESDLTPELDDLRKKKIAESLDELRKAWSAPGVSPALPVSPPAPAVSPNPRSPPAELPAVSPPPASTPAAPPEKQK